MTTNAVITFYFKTKLKIIMVTKQMLSEKMDTREEKRGSKQ